MASAALEALLILNISNFIDNLKKADTESKKSGTNIGNAFTNAGTAITNAGLTLTAKLTTPLVALGTKITKVGIDFEKEMSNVQALSGATGEDFDRLRDKAREMGSKTAYSATEAAEALSFMALAGYDTDQMIDSLAGVLYLAGASALDLGTASDIVTDSITAFGLSAKDTDRFVDVLAVTMSSSNTSTQQLGEAFKYVAPLAGALGFTVEDTSVALGLMADAGIKSSRAGTTLRRALSNLVNPTEKQATAMEELGIEITNSDGSMKSLDEILRIIRGSFANLTQAEQAQAASTIFGTTALSGMLAVINTSDERYDELTEAIQNCDGAAQQLYETQQDNLAGSFAIMSSAAEEAALIVYDILVPAIRGAVDAITDMFVWFQELNSSQQEFIVGVGIAAAAIPVLLVVLGKMLTLIGNIINGQTKLQIAVKAMTTTWQESAIKQGIVNTVTGAYNRILDIMNGKITISQALHKAYNATLGKLVTRITSTNLVIGVYNTVTDLMNKNITIGEALHKLFDSTLGAVASKLGLTQAATIAYNVVQGVLNGSMTLGAAASGLLAAAMNLIPFVALATAAFALVKGIQKVVEWFRSGNEEAKKMKEETDALISSTEELTNQMNDNAEAHESRIETIRNQGIVAAETTAKINDLMTAEEQSSESTAKINAYVGLLNESYEDLNLTYDETTNTLSMTQEEIDKVIDSQTKLNETQQQQERYNEIALELLEIDTALNEVYEQRDYWADWYEETGKKSKEYKDAIADLDAAEEELTAQQELLNGQLVETEERLIECANATEENFGGATENMLAYSEEQTNALDKLKDEYTNTQDVATDMFSKISDESEISLTEMIENLEHNQQAVKDWSENLAYLTELGVDEGLLKTLEDAGPSSAAYVQTIVDGSEEEILHLSDAFRNGGDVATESLVARLGEGSEETAEAARLLAQTTDSALRDEIKKQDFGGSGEDMVTGYVNGIEAQKEKAEEAGEDIGEASANGLENELEINSPSKVTERIGEYFGEGLAIGIPKKQGDIISAIRFLANGAITECYAMGQNMVYGIADGVLSASNYLNAQMKYVAEMAVITAQTYLQIYSPSRLMRDKVGKMIPAGIAVGVEKNADMATDAVEDMVSTLSDGAMDSNISVTGGVNDLIADTLSAFVSNINTMIGDVANGNNSLASLLADGGNVQQAYSEYTTDNSTIINIESINVRSDEELKTVSRALFNRDATTLRAQGR